ncbi:amidohydrolase family protein [Aquirufa sp. LEPPI-3A]|uniref:amidohydrolase family protein n=1 Tax=Aquirufa regiilacus TaxID=3024868 RepID=UPI0028DDC0BB|nr:amidohydrolase family protein [Aquirufa sp. LEPPI-3A]MDT8886892.1 amidohydrolase family protein [Aquirufa sp. LEPPI-3A]
MIDSHQHFWNYDAERDTWITADMAVIKQDFYPNVDLFSSKGIHACVAVQASSSEEETLFLLALAEQSNFIQGVVGWVDLQQGDIEDRLAYFSQFETLKGFRHIVQGEEDPEFLKRSDFIRGVKALDAFDYTYDLLILPHQLKEGIEFCQQLDQKIVMDHLAKPPIKSGDVKQWKKDIGAFKELEHVSAKISGLITEADWKTWTTEQINEVIQEALEVFGPDRLLFGTDYPVVKVAGELDQWIDVYKSSISALSPNEQAKINEQNCKNFYALD